MSETAKSEFRLPDLRIVPSDALVPHEREDESRAGRLSERFRQSGLMKNPPIVTEAVSADSGPRFVVLDGANRVSAARATKLPHVLVQVVRYDEPGMELTTWHHALSGFPVERLARELAKVAGLRLASDGIDHTTALLAPCTAIPY